MRRPLARATTFAKIVQPSFAVPLLRRRLFRLLDSRTARVAWVSGPPGSGKTILASTYVETRKLRTVWYRLDETDADPSSLFHFLRHAVEKVTRSRRAPLPALTIDRLGSLEVFARQFFVDLYARLRPPFALVFDNAQDVPRPSAFDAVLRIATLELPEGGRILVLSRSEPPPELARLQTERGMVQLSWPELRLTAGETKTIASRWRSTSLASKLHQATGGWAAGLELMLQRARLSPGQLQRPRLADEQAVFDYFAAEIFSRTDPRTQRVLLTSALLPEMPEHALARLTGITEAAELLARLGRTHYFTEQRSGAETTFVYHPLFRGFLLAQGERTIPAAELSALREQAGELLVEHGRLEQAAALFGAAKSYASLVRLVVAEAESLLTSGRWQTLLGWLEAIPPELRDRDPRLLYWYATCTFTFQPLQARELFRRALDGFRASGDASGSYLAWVGGVETFFYEWADFHPLDAWLALLEQLQREHPRYPSLEISARVAGAMMTALKFRKPDDEALPSWAERAQRLLPQVGSVESRLVIGASLAHYHVVTWNLRKGAMVLDSLRPLATAAGASPLARLLWLQMESAYHCFVGRPEACLEAVRDGLETARESGIQALDFHLLVNGTLASLAMRDLAGSRRFLQRMSFVLASNRRVDVSLYHMLAACDALYRADHQTALEHGRRSVAAADEAGAAFLQPSNQLYLALALFASGDHGEAGAIVDAALLAGRAMRAPLTECMALLARAAFALSLGNAKAARPLLGEGFGLARAHGYSTLPLWPTESMARLCVAALQGGIEREHVRELIRVRGLEAPEPAQLVEDWPWRLRIASFGGLRLLREGKPLRFGRKTQRRALELLSALVAFGPGGIADERLIAALWPDSNDPQRALNTALHRLRRLLGDARHVVRDAGVLRLDACWIDAWALDEALDAIKRELRGAPNGQPRVEQLLEQLNELYGGPFLDGERETPWLIGARDRLRAKLVRQLRELASHAEHGGDFTRAVECHERALAADELDEEGYRRLIRCHRRRGHEAAARRVLKQCSEKLTAELGTRVSAETLAALSSPLDG
ncbi:MAG TPA: BTAD domain-containing putative transcriptional regulator [Polyangiaceae bacterium]|nr:BTAD domain-containing putative transcriptional regulator [Polyangiaceae bacterium]